MKPCPRCRHTVSLQELDAELERLSVQTAPESERFGGGNGNIAIGYGANAVSGSIPADSVLVSDSAGKLGWQAPPAQAPPSDTVTKKYFDEQMGKGKPNYGDLTVCAGCGYAWVPDARDRAKETIESIRRLKIAAGPVEAIGDLDRPEPS